ncbi:hypothetical protein D3C73_1427860 [compost metagenome]
MQLILRAVVQPAVPIIGSLRENHSFALEQRNIALCNPVGLGNVLLGFLPLAVAVHRICHEAGNILHIEVISSVVTGCNNLQIGIPCPRDVALMQLGGCFCKLRFIQVQHRS